jgi:hypothetical protein
MILLLARHWAARRFLSSTAATKEVRRMAMTRLEVPPRLINILKEKHANLDLIKSMYSVKVSLDDKALLLEGEDDVVASVSPKFLALQAAKDESQIIDALSSILGEPVRVRMAMSLPLLEKKSSSKASIQPLLLNKHTWVVGTSDNIAHVWSDDGKIAKEAANLLGRLSKMVKDFQDGKNPSQELKPHPSFTWLDRPEFQALGIKDVLLDKTKDCARVWAVDDTALEGAKQFLTSPYRPPHAEDTVFEFELFTDGVSRRLGDLRSVARAFEERNDTSMRITKASERALRIESFWPLEVVLKALTRDLQGLLRGAEDKLSLGAIITDESTVHRTKREISNEFGEGELAVGVVRVRIPSKRQEHIVALLCSPSVHSVNAGRLFFDSTPGLIKLNLPALRDLQHTISETFVGRIGRDVLQWGDDGRRLRHWGRNWFSAVDESQTNESMMKQRFNQLSVAIVDELNKGAGYSIGVAIWHMDKGKRMVVAKDKQTLQAYLARTNAVPLEVVQSAKSLSKGAKATQGHW